MVRPQTGLREWLDSLIGEGKPFRSDRDLSLKSGLSNNTVNNLRARGTAGPETLVAIADAAGVSRTAAFIQAGWLRESDVKTPAMTPKQTRLFELVKSLPAEDVDFLVGAAERLHRYASRIA